MNTLIDIALTSSHKASHLLVIVYVALSGHSDTHAYVQTHILGGCFPLCLVAKSEETV